MHFLWLKYPKYASWEIRQYTKFLERDNKFSIYIPIYRHISDIS